ncbi:50S ribosomal protein L6 [Candidatus Bathyarchaeota archaeon]|nr:50S ribosomal protein L6 [Candidatus Bathyarchaeota archaeon]
MKRITVARFIEIPENVDVQVKGRTVTVKGPRGALTRDFSHAPVSITKEKNVITVKAYWPRRREEAIVGTIYSHINNMIKGVTEGFVYKMKIVFSHFPISVRVDGNQVLIENFTGEKSPRRAKIIGDTKVTVKGDDIIIEGIDIEAVSQTAANIQQATKIKNKDPRVFLDGIYVYETCSGVA